MTGSGPDVQLLGDVAVRRDGVALALPASRKCRALLAYLALSPRTVTCQLDLIRKSPIFETSLLTPELRRFSGPL
jgi:hypothetical protein